MPYFHSLASIDYGNNHCYVLRQITGAYKEQTIFKYELTINQYLKERSIDLDIQVYCECLVWELNEKKKYYLLCQEVILKETILFETLKQKKFCTLFQVEVLKKLVLITIENIFQVQIRKVRMLITVSQKSICMTYKKFLIEWLS